MQKDNLGLDFEQHSVRDWEKIAQQELAGDPWVKLTKENSGLRIKPYYDSSDSIKENKIAIHSSDRNWVNSPKVVVVNEKKANAEALTHLNSGADGVFFELQFQSVNFDALLRDIQMQFCTGFFSTENNSADCLRAFADYIIEKPDQEKIAGAFFFKDLQTENLDISKYKTLTNFHSLSISVKENESIVDEIVDSLLTAVDIIDKLTKEKISTEQAFQLIAFSVSACTDFFLTASKVRALKNLWLALQAIRQIKNPAPAFVHVNSKKWIKDSYQPQGNMLKQTTTAMAAVIAGCDAISVEAEDDSNSMMSRTARNVSSMLREESHLSLVNDPLAGSFYIESLTNQIAAQVWSKIQSMKPEFKNTEFKSVRSIYKKNEGWLSPEQILINSSINEDDLKNSKLRNFTAGLLPYLRGLYATMYTVRPWTVLHNAVFSLARESNA